MTDQELRDLVAENTKNIANLAHITNQLVRQIEASNKRMEASDKKWTDAINVMIQLGYRIDDLESKRPSTTSGRTHTEPIAQAAKPRN